MSVPILREKHGETGGKFHKLSRRFGVGIPKFLSNIFLLATPGEFRRSISRFLQLVAFRAANGFPRFAASVQVSVIPGTALRGLEKLITPSLLLLLLS